MDRTISTFLVLHTPVTAAPNDLAICTANVPTPPAAPLIKTLCPFLILPLPRSPCSAVNAATGEEAACSYVTLSGFRNNVDSGAHAYSAKAPWQTQTLTLEACGSRIHTPNTSSPGLNCVTSLPTASTWPATSTPSRVTFGLRSPVRMRPLYGLPPSKPPSSGLTEAAR